MIEDSTWFGRSATVVTCDRCGHSALTQATGAAATRVISEGGWHLSGWIYEGDRCPACVQEAIDMACRGPEEAFPW